jgi:serine/threonine-protein kinase
MVTFDGFAKVVDFGVAKSRHRTQVTRFGVVKGKVSYLSPEQVRIEHVDRRSDLFSFGTLLYLLTTDRHPFRGRSPVETIQHIASRAPHAPRDLVPDLPPALDRLILRALAKDPADRFQTAAELQRELEEIIVSLGGPLGPREVGRVALRLVPGAAARMRSQLVAATERLDRGAVPWPRERPAPAPARPDEEVTVREGRVWRTPRGTAAPAPARQRAGGRVGAGPLTTVAAIALLAATALAAHTRSGATPPGGAGADAVAAASRLPRWVLRLAPPERPRPDEVTPALCPGLLASSEEPAPPPIAAPAAAVTPPREPPPRHAPGRAAPARAGAPPRRLYHPKGI